MANQMLGEFKKAMTKNMKRLNEMAQGSLEMQQLLLQTGERYIAETKAFEDDGQTLFAASQSKKRRKSAAGASVDAPPSMDIPEGIMMRRGLRVYRNWGQKMCADFLGYIEPKIRMQVSPLPLQTVQELIEYACDLRLTGDVLDRVGHEDKNNVFEAGAETYKALVRRLSGDIPSNAPMDWAKFGHFKGDASQAPDSLSVTCALLDQMVKVGQDVLRGDPGPFQGISKNFSRFQASLCTERDEYKLAGLFPRLSRSLLRRPSEVTGLAGSAISAAENAAEARADPDSHEQDDDVPEISTT